MNEEISWRASETESIEPFKTFSEGLEPCALRLQASGSFDRTNVQEITSTDFWTNFQPAIHIGIDLDDLVDATGLDHDNIMISVVIRDREINKFTRVYQCEALALPTEPIELKSLWSDFSQSGRVDLSVVATPRETADRGPGVATHKADVVACRTFKLRTMTQSPRLPTRWVPSAEFEKRGAPGDTVWLINWLGEDLERSPAETVEVLLNENLRDAFKVLDNKGEMANLIHHQMAASIFSEIAVKVIKEDSKPIEETGLRKSVFEELSRSSGLNDDQILALQDQSNFFGIVHALTQAYTGLNHSFANL